MESTTGAGIVLSAGRLQTPLILILSVREDAEAYSLGCALPHHDALQGVGISGDDTSVCQHVRGALLPRGNG